MVLRGKCNQQALLLHVQCSQLIQHFPQCRVLVNKLLLYADDQDKFSKYHQLVDGLRKQSLIHFLLHVVGVAGNANEVLASVEIEIDD